MGIKGGSPVEGTGSREMRGRFRAALEGQQEALIEAGLLAGIVVCSNDLGELGPAGGAGTLQAMFVAVPLLLAFMAKDKLPLATAWSRR
jgi:hypothetical protein